MGYFFFPEVRSFGLKMPKEMINFTLDRKGNEPWGFVIVGGKDQVTICHCHYCHCHATICLCWRQGPGDISIPPPFKLKSIEGSAFALSGPDSEAGQDQSVLQRWEGRSERMGLCVEHQWAGGNDDGGDEKDYDDDALMLMLAVMFMLQCNLEKSWWSSFQRSWNRVCGGMKDLQTWTN